MGRSKGKSALRLVQGDITDEVADAIVNAANSTLLGGGGVDGAIHRAGGPSILEECRGIRESRGGCPTGEAVATTAGKLSARFVLHTVGPVWHGGRSPRALPGGVRRVGRSCGPLPWRKLRVWAVTGTWKGQRRG